MLQKCHMNCSSKENYSEHVSTLIMLFGFLQVVSDFIGISFTPCQCFHWHQFHPRAMHLPYHTNLSYLLRHMHAMFL